MNTARWSRSAALIVGAGAVSLWLSSRLVWVTVSAFDDKSGDAVRELPGAVWASEVTVIALVLLAGTLGAFALRGAVRRGIGALTALAAVGASWAPLSLLAGSPDPERARMLLTSGAATQRANSPVTLSDWATVTGLDVHITGPVVAFVGCALALVGGVLLVLRPGAAAQQASSRYVTPGARQARLEEDLEQSPDSGRVLWDALDADIDPTDD
ncbi:TIGR02234 family membrane protein [Corynebacterium sp. CCM 9185]|uniref:TIGR02234 family membrane protein n=1 Tax=Corynebacterium marambiense TaxID=2765364 RepID=A0ABS0VVK9_9CORY|nr:TIGR02234 family membrane protein [Corynebacterium marambiense]MBI9000802.1 TIGR02234 family membrane protein [Corynebacterium marambiense]MCK7662931.1 TIGR02234 family membrane protein [Corynebacterium marambiense]MCX7542540.1 TIGR02234 family membrane protein [Corynebacterium marambiense]